MYVKAIIHVPFSSALVVPSSAVLFTGERTLVWVEVRENTFEPREVTVGMTSGSVIEILKGLKVRENVVTTGAFLLESESQLQQPDGTTSRHQHDTPKINEKIKMQPSQDEHKGNHIQSEVKIIVNGNYSPNVIHAKRGKKLTIAFERHDESKCTDEVVFEDFNIRKILPSHQTTVVELTPQKAGEFAFSCGMKMIHGTLIVHE
jgi:hypothetical protein